MSNHSITVEKQGEYHDVDADVLEDFLQARIGRYLKKRRSRIQHCELNLVVLACDIEPLTGAAFFKARLEGRFNRKSISQSFRQKRGSGGHSVSSAAVNAAISTAVNAARRSDDNPFGLGGGGLHLVDCIDDCVASMEIVLDQALGIGESSAANRWKFISLMCWVIPFVTAVLNLGSIAIHGSPLKLPLIYTVMYFPSLYLLVRCVGYLIMPASFFKDDPRGRQAMTRVGVNSIVAMRILSALLVLALSAASLFLLALSHMQSQPPQGASM